VEAAPLRALARGRRAHGHAVTARRFWRMSAQQKRIEQTLSVLAAVYEKTHGEPPKGVCRSQLVEKRTPFDIAAEKDDAADRARLAGGTMPMFEQDRPTAFEELNERAEEAERESAEAAQMWLEAQAWLLDFLFADGPHPGVVMRRLYIWVKKYRPDLIWDAGYRQIGDLFGESGAVVEWRLSQIVDGYSRARGIRNVQMPWQRTADACQSYSEVQEGNANRVGGKKAGKTKAKKRI